LQSADVAKALPDCARTGAAIKPFARQPVKAALTAATAAFLDML